MAGKGITASSTAEYFAKNLQQVGFSSLTKAVLTTIKEAVDNSLDACEEEGILPEITVAVQKKGPGTIKNSDRILVAIEDNGPGLTAKQVPMVFGQYLASSKFGRGRCSRGQQGIGISAATTWAMQTTATGAKITTKKSGSSTALQFVVNTDLKKNVGVVVSKESVDWPTVSGTRVEFLIDGRIQLNGDGGLLNYLRGTALLNPHLTLNYELPDAPPKSFERISQNVPKIPDATLPHPHTMKLGEFVQYATLFGNSTVEEFLSQGFSRLDKDTAKELSSSVPKKGAKLSDLPQNKILKEIFEVLQNQELKPPLTKSVMAVGEEALALSIQRLGKVNFISVVSRKPVVCDFKPVQVEVALARLDDSQDPDGSVQVLRFANRVPLQFDKAACAIVKAISSVNWKSYGLKQPRGSLPTGPYVFAVSVVSPFIKFKNASKETIDASEELVTELRRALMQAGQKLARYLKREGRARDIQQRSEHIEQFCPILVEALGRIVDAKEPRLERARAGLKKILEKETHKIAALLDSAEKDGLADDDMQKYLAEFQSSLEDNQSSTEEAGE